MRMTRMMLVGVVFSIATTQVQASIVWDYSPGTTGAQISGTHSNISNNQYFAEDIQFVTGVSLTGMDIYSHSDFGFVGELVDIRLWSDNAGAPNMLLQLFSETISVVDTDGVGANNLINRKHVDFSNALSLSAGTTYWISMSGDYNNFVEIAQGSLFGSNAPDDQKMAMFGSGGLIRIGDFGDMSFRLHSDEITSTPEPTSMALLGLGGLGLRLRRNRKAQTAA